MYIPSNSSLFRALASAISLTIGSNLVTNTRWCSCRNSSNTFEGNSRQQYNTTANHVLNSSCQNALAFSLCPKLAMLNPASVQHRSGEYTVDNYPQNGRWKNT